MGNKAAKAQRQEQFGAGSTFEKMSRATSNMLNSFTSKNQTAAQEVIKKKYKSVGMGDDVRKAKVLTLLKQRYDLLDAKKDTTAIEKSIEDVLSKDGLGNSMALPTEQWWKAPKSSFGRRRRSNVKRRAVEFGRKRRSSHKRRSSFGKKRRSSKRRV
jgi:hypothetical protein